MSLARGLSRERGKVSWSELGQKTCFKSMQQCFGLIQVSYVRVCTHVRAVIYRSDGGTQWRRSAWKSHATNGLNVLLSLGCVCLRMYSRERSSHLGHIDEEMLFLSVYLWSRPKPCLLLTTMILLPVIMDFLHLREWGVKRRMGSISKSDFPYDCAPFNESKYF